MKGNLTLEIGLPLNETENNNNNKTSIFNTMQKVVTCGRILIACPLN